MEPVFFSWRTNSLEKNHVDKISATIEKIVRILNSKIINYTSLEELYFKFSWKLAVFISEFKSLQCQDTINPEAWSALDLCCNSISKLHTVLNRFEKDQQASLQSILRHSTDVFLTQLASLQSDKHLFPSQLRDEQTLGEVKPIPTSNLAEASLPSSQSISPKAIASSIQLPPLPTKRELEVFLLKLANSLDPFALVEFNTCLETAVQEKFKLYCQLIVKYYSDDQCDSEKDALFRKAMHLLGNYIATTEEDYLKQSLAKYFLITFKIFKFQTEILNLVELYNQVEEELLHKGNAELAPYFKIKLAEVIEIHLRFTSLYPKKHKHYITKQRQLLLAVALDNTPENVELKVKASYLLATSFISSKPKMCNYFMAKKHFSFVLEHGKGSFYEPCAHYHLGKLLIFGFGQSGCIDIQTGSDHLNRALENPLLPGILKSDVKKFNSVVEKLDKSKVLFDFKDQNLVTLRNELLKALYLSLEDDPNKIGTHIFQKPNLNSKVKKPSFQEIFNTIFDLTKSDATEEIKKGICLNELQKLSAYFSHIVKQKQCLADKTFSSYRGNVRYYSSELLSDVNEKNIRDPIKKLEKLKRSTNDSIYNWGMTIQKHYTENCRRKKFINRYNLEGKEHTWDITMPAINEHLEIIKDVQHLINQKSFDLKNQMFFCDMLRGFEINPNQNSEKDINSEFHQKQVIRYVNYMKIALSVAEKFSLYPKDERDTLLLRYEQLKEISPPKHTAKIWMASAKLSLENHRQNRVFSKNLITSDSLLALLNFRKAYHSSKDDDEKMEILKTITLCMGLNSASVTQIIHEIQSSVIELISEKVNKDSFHIKIAVLQFLTVAMEYFKYVGEDEKAVEINRAIQDSVQSGALNKIEFLETACECCTTPKATNFQLMENIEQQNTFMLSLLPDAPAFLPAEQVRFTKSSHKVASLKETWASSLPAISTTHETKQAAASWERKIAKKAEIKGLKSHVVLNKPEQTPLCMTRESLPHIYISKKGMGTLQKIFTPNSAIREASDNPALEACNFRTDLKIKQQEVIDLVVELGGSYLPKEGKGSHEKCTLASLQKRDCFVLKDTSFTLANFEIFEAEANSQMIILTSASYLKPYQIRQLCSKLISLSFTPETVHEKLKQ